MTEVRASAHVPSPAGACPRCDTPRAADQRYCLDCGLRLPPAIGALASFRRGWVRWFGWYPGDWAFPALAALLIAAVGAAGAAELSRRGDKDGRALVAATPAVAEGSGGADRVGSPGTSGPRALPSPSPNGRTKWPAGEGGWTVVLVSFPRELGLAPARDRAKKAVRAALPEVGFLLSDRFASLHPGYFVVFTGVYYSRAEAEAAVPTARSKGFGGAYARRVVP
jgi:hypothetical protein